MKKWLLLVGFIFLITGCTTDIKMEIYSDIKQNDSTLIMITCPRKKSEKVMAIIRNYDKDSEIITEKVKSFS